MKELLTYLAEVIVCSTALLAAYALLLERRVRFGWCRRYLMALLPLAALIPLLRIPVWPGEVITVSPVPTAPIPAAAWTPAPEVLPAAETFVTPRTLLIAVYLLGTATLAAAMLREALRIRRLRRRATVTGDGHLHLVRTQERIASFSFFRSVYVWEGTPGEEMQAVLMHEASHIAHRHTAERLLMETFKALQWWNPVAWVAARRLTEVQEFEADRDVLKQGFDRERYMHTIFRQLFGYSPDIANGLRDSLTKKRFQMMTTNHTSRHALLRVAGTVPVLAGLLCAFSFTAQAARIETESGASHERVIYLLNGREVPAAEIRAAEPDALTVDRFYSSENLPAEYRDRHPELVIAFTAEEPLRHYTPIRIEGTVTNPDGSPAADILLYAGAMGTHPLDAEAYPARTDAEGRFSLTGPARGSLTYASNTAENSFTRVTTYDSEGADPYRMQLEVVDPDTEHPQTDADVAERTAVEHPTDATSRPAPATDEDDTPFLVAEEMPLFQGQNLNTFRTWVQSQIRYPAEALKRGIEGRVVLSFIVERDGSVSTIELLQSPDRILSEEVRRIVASSPQWTPGRQKGHLVRVRYMLPVDFSIPKEEAAAQEPGMTPPQFEGGDINAFRSWAMQRLRYPAKAREQQTEGSVVATFTVGRDGRVDDIRIAGKPDPQLAEEVRRVVKASPAWSPATRNGEATTVTVTLPVSFRIQGSGHPLEEVPAASATTVERIVVTAFPTPARETAPDTASATR